MARKKGGVLIGKHPAVHSLHHTSEDRCSDISFTRHIGCYAAVLHAPLSRGPSPTRAKILVPGAGPVEGSHQQWPLPMLQVFSDTGRNTHPQVTESTGKEKRRRKNLSLQLLKNTISCLWTLRAIFFFFGLEKTSKNNDALAKTGICRVGPTARGMTLSSD